MCVCHRIRVPPFTFTHVHGTGNAVVVACMCVLVCTPRGRYDKPLCERGVTNCSAPLFTFDKRWNASAYAAGLPGSAHDDVLHPVMNHPFEVREGRREGHRV